MGGKKRSRSPKCSELNRKYKKTRSKPAAPPPLAGSSPVSPPFPPPSSPLPIRSKFVCCCHQNRVSVRFRLAIHLRLLLFLVPCPVLVPPRFRRLMKGNGHNKKEIGEKKVRPLKNQNQRNSAHTTVHLRTAAAGIVEIECCLFDRQVGLLGELRMVGRGMNARIRCGGDRPTNNFEGKGHGISENGNNQICGRNGGEAESANQ